MLDLIVSKNLDKPSPVHYEQPIIKFQSSTSMYFFIKLGLWENLQGDHWAHLKNILDLDLIKLRNPFHNLYSAIKNAKLERMRGK